MTQVTEPVQRCPLAYLAVGVHRGGGMERAAYEVIQRLAPARQITVIGKECECDRVRFEKVHAPRRPAVLEISLFRWQARRRLQRCADAITTGIGGSGGPVDVVVAQYCQEAYRQRVGAVRANGPLQAWWQRRNMARFCAEERAVYQSPLLKRVIAVSRGVGRELVEFYGVDPVIIRYIPNGVDLSTFCPLTGGSDARRQLRAELGLPTDGFMACFVGGDWRRKGLRPAIEALRLVPDVRLAIVGAGDKSEFAAIAAAAGVGDRVHFVGRRPDPHRYLQASDTYLFPSLYEAFSLSCIEAAACGLPLLVTKINGTDELVEDGTNGFFVEHEPASIAARLRQLRDDPDLRDRMARRSAEVGQRYGWDAIAAAHEAVYAELDRSFNRPGTA
jgi:UDP-glucose:(heptosyl)LPS alpha-1,3-glucosyltransferase